MALELIETIELTASAASIEFTSIPQDGVDLLIKMSLRGSHASNSANLFVQFNSDTGANYDYVRLVGNGSSASTFSASSQTRWFLQTAPGGAQTSNTFSNNAFYISNYTSSTDKSGSYEGIMENNATDSVQALFATNYNTTSGISSVKVYTDSGESWVQYSTISLYKIS